MSTILEQQPPASLRSKITTKWQTTLPSGVRKAVGLAPGDEVEYVIEGNRATLRKVAPTDDNDPALAPFLDLLQRDITEHPERIAAMPRATFDRMRKVARSVRIDRHERIDGPVAL